MAGLKKLNNGSAQDALKCLNSQKIGYADQNVWWILDPTHYLVVASKFCNQVNLVAETKFG